MSRYLLTSTCVDYDAFMRRNGRDLGPGHAVVDLARKLGAEIVQPDPRRVTWTDRIAARLIGHPEHWATARMLAGRLRAGDLVYATGEDAGLPLAVVNLLRRRRGAIAIHFLAPTRPRVRVMGSIVGRLGRPMMAATGTKTKALQISAVLGHRGPSVVADEQTDTSFFRPATTRWRRDRPLVVSAGLEQRDYETLVAAVADLDVDVKICAASPNSSARTTVALPDVLPEHVEMGSFEFHELRELYQQADVTVLSILANPYAAGSTALIEAVACGSPVIMSEGMGTPKEFIDDGLIVGVPPGDVGQLRAALLELLADPTSASARAMQARAVVLRKHSRRSYVDNLYAALVAFEAGRSLPSN